MKNMNDPGNVYVDDKGEHYLLLAIVGSQAFLFHANGQVQRWPANFKFLFLVEP